MDLIARNIVGTIEKPNGARWANATVKFSPAATQADGTIVVPRVTVEAVTDGAGAFTAPLKTLENGYLNYDVQLPNREVRAISLPDAPGDADLSDLLSVAASAPEIAIRIASETMLGGVRIDGTTIIIDEDGVISAVGGGSGGPPSGGAGGVLSGSYPNPGFAVNMATQAELDAVEASLTAAIASAIANLINSAPGALDTLDELAAALGDDANFAATVTASLATKVPKLSGAVQNAVYFKGASAELEQDGAAFLFDPATDTLKLGAASYLGNSPNAGGGYAGVQSFLQVGFDTAYVNNAVSVYGILADMKRSQTSGAGQQTSGIRPRAWLVQTGGSSTSAIATGCEAFASNQGSTVQSLMLQGVEGIANVFYNAFWSYGGYFQSASQTAASGGTGSAIEVLGGVISRINNATGWTANHMVAYDSIAVVGGTVNNLYGLRMTGWGGAGAVNSYGIYMDTSIDRGSSVKYAIYSLSTSPSLFSGVVKGVTPVANEDLVTKAYCDANAGGGGGGGFAFSTEWVGSGTRLVTAADDGKVFLLNSATLQMPASMSGYPDGFSIGIVASTSGGSVLLRASNYHGGDGIIGNYLGADTTKTGFGAGLHLVWHADNGYWVLLSGRGTWT